MKRLFCIPSFSRLLRCLPLLLLLSACVQEELLPVSPGSNATPVEVTFTLTTLGGGETRMGEDKPGVGLENAIDWDKLRILLFDAEDTFLETFEPITVTEFGNEYQVQGQLSEAYSNFKVVVLANWPDVPPTFTTIQALCEDALSSSYHYTPPFTLSEDNLIPMYGVLTFNGELNPDSSTNLGKISLLRAMCKIEVQCSEEIKENYSLKEVTLHRYATKGMCAPTEVYKDTEADWQDENEKVHLPDDCGIKEEDLPLTDNENGSFIVYVPEIENNAEEGAHSYLTVTLVSKDKPEEVLYIKNPNIYFRDYTDGQVNESSDYYDLIRNHWYRFQITGVSGVDLEFVVLSWDEVKADVTFD